MIITLTGANDFLLMQAQRQLTTAHVTEYGHMGLERLDGEEATFERISEALTSLPFLASKKMVLLKRPSGNKQFTEKAEELLKNAPETTDVLLVEPKLDKRSAYFKYLKKATDYREFSELDANGLARWLVERAKEQRGKLSQSDALYLVGRVGQSQQLLASELEKLLLYEPHVTHQTIDLLTEATPQSTVFELLDAAFNGRTQQMLDLYRQQRALKVEPQQIIAMLAWQLHIVALIKTAGDRTPDAIAGEAKVSPYTVKKSVTIARRLSLVELKNSVNRLATIDARSKREAYSLDDALQHYLLALAI